MGSNDLNRFANQVGAKLQGLEVKERGHLLAAMAGILDLAEAGITDPRAQATFDQVHQLCKQKRQGDALDLIQDWQARRLLAEALPDWDFGDPNPGGSNEGRT